MQRLIEPGSGRPLPLEQVLDVEDVLDAAAEWKAGRMTAYDAGKLGAIVNNGEASPAYTRFKALAKTPRSDPRWLPLLELCQKLAQLQGHKMTRQGCFSSFEASYCARETEDLLERGVIYRGFREKGNW